MSCRACEEAQGVTFNDDDGTDEKDVIGLKQLTYVRVGNGNVLISGCEKHLKQLLDQNKAGAKALE